MPKTTPVFKKPVPKTPKQPSQSHTDAIEVLKEGIAMLDALSPRLDDLERDLATAEQNCELDNFVNFYCFAERVGELANARELDFMEGHDSVLANLVEYSNRLSKLEREFYDPELGFPGLFAYEICGQAAAEKFLEMMDFETGAFPNPQRFESQMLIIITNWLTGVR